MVSLPNDFYFMQGLELPGFRALRSYDKKLVLTPNQSFLNIVINSQNECLIIASIKLNCTNKNLVFLILT